MLKIKIKSNLEIGKKKIEGILIDTNQVFWYLNREWPHTHPQAFLALRAPDVY